MSNDKKVVYVAGPYTKGDVTQNVAKAIAVGDTLLSNGIVPVIPHLSHFWDMISHHTYSEWLAYTMHLLLRCDAMYRLPGKSNGADLEEKQAFASGIPVYYDLDQVVDVYGGEKFEAYEYTAQDSKTDETEENDDTVNVITAIPRDVKMAMISKYFLIPDKNNWIKWWADNGSCADPLCHWINELDRKSNGPRPRYKCPLQDFDNCNECCVEFEVCNIIARDPKGSYDDFVAAFNAYRKRIFELQEIE